MDPHVIRRGLIVAVALLATVATPVAVRSSARAEEPLRSGTIAGWGYTWPAMFSGQAGDCEWSEWNLGAGNPECSAWLASGCDPELAGRDPAVTASIEDVSELADGRTVRQFEWWSDVRIASSETEFGGVVVQLWTGDCQEIREGKWRSHYWDAWHQRHKLRVASFPLPRHARWMTVTTNDTVNVRWTLT